MDIVERLAKLEQKVVDGFDHLNHLFDNHLGDHDKKEKFQQKVIIALIAIIGSASVSILILLIGYLTR